jgi:DNA-binding NtrC family response regulator
MVEQKSKKDLEATIKEKVAPLLEETLEKNFGVTIPKLESDITDRLSHPVMNVYVPLIASYKEAKKKFKQEFLRRELVLKHGNVSQLAKILGVDRRSVHRAIKEFEIDVDLLRGQEESGEMKYKEQVVGDKIRGALEQYKGIFHPERMEHLYKDVPLLSKHIAQVLPLEQLSWKEAEREFEKQFFRHHVAETNGGLRMTAQKLGLRVETLQRKIKKLGI